MLNLKDVIPDDINKSFSQFKTGMESILMAQDKAVGVAKQQLWDIIKATEDKLKSDVLNFEGSIICNVNAIRNDAIKSITDNSCREIKILTDSIQETANSVRDKIVNLGVSCVVNIEENYKKIIEFDSALKREIEFRQEEIKNSVMDYIIKNSFKIIFSIIKNFFKK